MLGFEISLDPPEEAKDSAAEVEITLAPTNSRDPAAELVALMPLEKTYNTAALSSHSNAFGGSAVVKVITVGYSEQRTNQTLYLYRDADTVAVQRLVNPPNSPQNAITFGWQFRPVLGRRAVSPGLRQMFAVVSLPARDTPEDNQSFPLKVSARTYWRPYHARTLTTSDKRGFWSRLWSSDLPDPALQYDSAINVFPTAPIQESLAAQVKNVEWTATDDKTAVILVDGSNFFHGTTVSFGGTVLSEANGGLNLKSDQSMQINAPLAAFGTGEAVINGRYGPSQLLRAPTTGLRVPAIYICSRDLVPTGDQFYSLFLSLATSCVKSSRSALSVEALPSGGRPLILINGLVNTQAYQIYDNEKTKEILIRTIVPAALVPGKNAVVTVRFPFVGNGWSPTATIYNPCPLKMTRLGGEKNTLLLISGVRDCGTKWRVLLDQWYELDEAHGPLRHPYIDTLSFDIDAGVLNKYKKLGVFSLTEAGTVLDAQVLDIPSATPAPEEPKLEAKGPQQVAQYEGRGVTYTGSGLKAITKVEFNGRPVSFFSKDGKSITVFLTSRVTAKPGLYDILLQTADGTIIPAPVQVTPAPLQTIEKK